MEKKEMYKSWDRSVKHGVETTVDIVGDLARVYLMVEGDDTTEEVYNFSSAEFDREDPYGEAWEVLFTIDRYCNEKLERYDVDMVLTEFRNWIAA